MYLGPIDHPEAIGQGNGLGPSTRYPDFVAIAKGFGCGAANVKKKGDLSTAAIKEMIAYPGPFVLDVEVPYQEHVLPMIPAGMTVKDLIKQEERLTKWIGRPFSRWACPAATSNS